MKNKRARWLALPVATILLLSQIGLAIKIDGVQPAAIDQPRVNLVIRRDAKGGALAGETATGGKTAFVEAFLDTGASGIMLSTHSADRLKIKRETAGDKDAVFTDVGVGGSDRFAVSEPLFLALAPYAMGQDADEVGQSDSIKASVGPARLQLGPLGGMGDGLMAMLAGDVDVVGMPAIAGKVVVLNTGVVNSFMDTIGAYVYEPNTADHPDLRKSDPGIPKTQYHVKLSLVSFKSFTTTTPAGAEGPMLAANPMIGPSPLPGRDAHADSPPGLTVTCNGKSSTGAWLLDTGAVASMISQSQAKAVGVQYATGTKDSDHPKLDGVPADRQFIMTIGGVGGSKRAAGFYLDALTLKTEEGQPIIFKNAPVLVSDITIEDPQTKKQLTLDGVFGMNFLVATAKIDETNLLPDIDKLTVGGFKWVVFNEPKAMLGLEPTDDVARSAK